MFKRLILVSLGLLIAIFTNTCLAWGKFGHLTICDLAYRNLTDTSKNSLKQLFNASSGGINIIGQNGVAKRHYTSFNLGCLEEDEIPRKHPKDHFLNVTRKTTLITKQAVCPAETDCVLSGIERDIATLKDASQSDSERVFSLMALGHWIGDIHQPLHVSFSDDKGGNSIDVKLAGQCGFSSNKAKNLHGVWDNCLLESGLFKRVRMRSDYKPSWNKKTITYRAVDTLLINTTLSEEKLIVASEPSEWANESFKITTNADVKYCVLKNGNCQYSDQQVEFETKKARRQLNIDQSYLSDFERIAEDRVRLAGFRLAHMLNLALDSNYTIPIQNSTQRP